MRQKKKINKLVTKSSHQPWHLETEPVGACCNGQECELLTREECANEGWIWRDGPCNPNPCLPMGACCDGMTCHMLSQKKCEDNDWRWKGGNCTPDMCVSHACCRSIGSNFIDCVDLPYNRCKEWCDKSKNHKIMWHEYSICNVTPGGEPYDYCSVATYQNPDLVNRPRIGGCSGIDGVPSPTNTRPRP